MYIIIVYLRRSSTVHSNNQTD